MLQASPVPVKLSAAVRLEALTRAIPAATLETVIDQCRVRERRCRKLPAHLMLLLPLVWALFPRRSQTGALTRLLHGLRLLPPFATLLPASKSAICQARYRLGARPLVALFHQVCRPLATPATVPDAFYGRWRLLAVDGTVEDVPDSGANARAFGRPTTSAGAAAGAFPQLYGVYLIECGTHAIIDAGFWPYRTGERLGGHRLLRSVDQTALLCWDCGYHSYAMAVATRARGAQFVGRLPAHVKPVLWRTLADGSQLVWLYPGTDSARSGRERLLVRLLRYRLSDPARGEVTKEHRLITALLNPVRHPALDLIGLYHERWEVELTIDEVDTHLRQLKQPLRSQCPVGVIQELYGVLLAHDAVRATMVDAAVAADTTPLRLSFTAAVELITDALPDFDLLPPAQQPARYARLLQDIGHQRLPPRANRVNVRAVKRKPTRFLTTRPYHRQCLQPSTTFRDAIVLLN
ncbi:MAG: IS4 family transposase [Dehalococcoidia bacterium]